MTNGRERERKKKKQPRRLFRTVVLWFEVGAGAVVCAGRTRVLLLRDALLAPVLLPPATRRRGGSRHVSMRTENVSLARQGALLVVAVLRVRMGM